MRIPHTIPKIVLKAYARKLNEEELAKSYEGRPLRAEDATWDKDAKPSLRDLCLDKVVEDYVFYVKLVEAWNKDYLQGHDETREKWKEDRAKYLERKASYDKKYQELEEEQARRLYIGDDPNDVDDDDDDVPTGAEEGRPTVASLFLKKGLRAPDVVSDEFPDYTPIGPVLDQLWDEDRIQAIEELDLEYVPFEMAVQTIPDDHYWERASRKKWDYIFDADEHGKKWRRLHLEKTLWEAIESYHPIDGDIDELEDLSDLIAPEIIKIKLNNLIPKCFGTPRKPLDDKIPDADFVPGGEEGDEGFGDGEEDPADLKELAKQKEKEQKALERKTKRKLKLQEKADKEKAERDLADAVAAAIAAAAAEGEEEEEEDDEEEGEEDEEEEEEDEEGEEEGDEDEEEGDEEEGDEEEMEDELPEEEQPDRTSSDHIDFGIILPKFTNLKVLSLVYEMQDTGLDWEKRFFIFTDNDCLSLAKALADTPSIETFELLRSHLNDEQCKTLIREGLIKMPHLKMINFSYNRLNNAGARAIARLLTDEESRAIHTIHTVKLARNFIHNEGGKALAWALTQNQHLTHLDLRINRIGDPAGRDFGHALVENHGLLSLQLGANRLTSSSAYVINKMLHHNNTLVELDLSSNALSEEGGDYMANGFRANKRVLRLDVRLADISLDLQYKILKHMRRNRRRVKYNLLDREDTYPNEKESGILVEKTSGEWSSEEEDEDEMDDTEAEEVVKKDEKEEAEGGEDDIQVVKSAANIQLSNTEL